jgi:predicted Zn-dependent protease
MVLNEMAITYQLQKAPQALTFAERAYTLHPAPAIADTLATILLDKGDKKRALELLENAVKSGTTNPEIRYHHAMALAQNGQNVKAKQMLHELLASKQPFQQEAEARALLERLN